MVMTAASAAYLNHALEPTPNSLRSCVAPALGRGSPRAFGCSAYHEGTEEGIGHCAFPMKSLSTLRHMTTRPRAVSLGQYGVFSLAVCAPVDYHV